MAAISGRPLMYSSAPFALAHRVELIFSNMSGAAAALMYSAALHLFLPISPLLIIITAHSIVHRYVGALFSGVACEGEAVWSSSHGRDKGLPDLPAQLAAHARPQCKDRLSWDRFVGR